MKKGIAILAAIVLAGCSLVSTLNQIAAWAKPVSTAIASVVAIVDPGGTKIVADVNAVVTLADDVATDAANAATAGAGQTGVAKVITDLTQFQSDATQIETDLSGVGATLSTSAKGYVTDALDIAVIGAEGWEAVLQAKEPAAAATSALNGHPIRLAAVRTSDGCAEFMPIPSPIKQVSYDPNAPIARVTMNCADSADAIDVTLTAAGDAVSNPTPTNPKGKAATAAQFKRQWNGICKKWGHPEKQLHVSAAETVVHLFTLGKR